MKEFIVHLLQCGHEHRCITMNEDILVPAYLGCPEKVSTEW